MVNPFRTYVENTIINTRKFQKQIDLHRVWKLVYLSKNQKSQQFSFQEKEMEWYKQPSDSKKFKQVNKILTDQISILLSKIKENDEKIPNCKDIYQERFQKPYLPTSEIEKWSELFLDVKYDIKKENTFESMEFKPSIVQNLTPNQELIELQRIEQERLVQLTSLLKSDIGWSPVVKDSKIQNAGKGLFIDGKCPKGSIVGFFPGMLYKKYPFELNEYHKNIGNFLINGNLSKETFFQTMHNHKVYFEQDQKKISFITKLLFKEDFYRKDVKYLGQRFIHPFANLQYVNHPPKWLLDNVLPFVVEIPFEFQRELLPYIPNAYFSDNSSFSNGMVASLVFISRRQLENEEVYVNYRLDPSQKIPSWYQSLNMIEDERYSRKE